MKTLYFLSIAFSAFLSTNMNAQIVYTDITDGIPAGIDFNSDGTMEFDVSTSGTETGCYLEYWNYGADNNVHALGTLATANWDVPNCVAAGFIVDATNQWEGQADCFITGLGGTPNPTITIDQDEYLAVRFNLVGTNVYYGWIRFSINSTGAITYKDYAYNSTPNTAIATGDKGAVSSVNELSKNNDFLVYPNPATSNITINNKSNNTITDVKIIDLLGNEVKNTTFMNVTNQTIDISNLTKGIYIVNILNGEQQVGQNKITVE